MAPESHCISYGHTTGLPWSHGLMLGVTVYYISIGTPAEEVVCSCKAKAGWRRSPRALHTRTRLSSLLILNLDSLLKTTWYHFTSVQSPRAQHHSKRRR
ncbi:uncharacterized protein TNCV_2037631 [Trichonephila clavipes]|nr:uncharacterized protein TNCV_2037631 [Trichonephila clavipes]